jgi:hypothetical protein
VVPALRHSSVLGKHALRSERSDKRSIRGGGDNSFSQSVIELKPLVTLLTWTPSRLCGIDRTEVGNPNSQVVRQLDNTRRKWRGVRLATTVMHGSLCVRAMHHGGVAGHRQFKQQYGYIDPACGSQTTTNGQPIFLVGERPELEAPTKNGPSCLLGYRSGTWRWGSFFLEACGWVLPGLLCRPHIFPPFCVLNGEPDTQQIKKN